MRSNFVKIIMLIALLAFIFPSVVTAKAANKKRVISAVSIQSSDIDTKIKLDIDGNLGRSLGKVYYSGKSIKIVLGNTKLAKGVKKSIKGDGLIRSVRTVRKGRNVWVMIKLKKKIKSIMEYLVFEPGLNSSTITVRKPAFFSAAKFNTEDTKAKNAQTDEVEKLIAEKPETENLIPLVAPKSIKDKSVKSTSTEATIIKDKEQKTANPVDATVIAKRKKLLSDLLPDDAKAQKSANDTKQAGIAATNINDQPLNVGKHVPDLTNLYVMTAIVLLIALLWFGIGRGKRVLRSTTADDPMTVIKTQNLGGKQKIMLVEVQGRRLLLSSSDKEVRLLTELDPGAEGFDQRPEPQKANVRYLFSKDSNEGGVDLAPGKRARSTNLSERPSYFDEQAASTNSFARKSAFGSSKSDMSIREKLRSLRKRG